MRLNPRLLETAAPPIPEAKAWAAGRPGGDDAPPLIDLSQAVPGAPPPPVLLQALAAAAGTAEAARYGDILGDHALRAAYARDVADRPGSAIEAADIAITAGCNQAFVVAMLALAAAGDRVILPVPWYFNHRMALDMLGIAAVPLACRAEAGFIPDPADAARLIDDRTRAIVLVSPNNPTGAVYPPAVIAAFADLCRRHGLALVLDETYRDFLPPEAGPPHNLFLDDAWRDTVISLYSFSKAYAIPGHRLGALIADRPVLAEVGKILDTLQICPARPAQIALAPLIARLKDARAANGRDMAARGEAFAAAIDRAGGGWRIDALGAYFAYLRHPFPGQPAAAVARQLAREPGVLTLPGSYFGPGQNDHLRVAFANVDAATLAGLADRLAGFEPAGGMDDPGGTEGATTDGR